MTQTTVPAWAPDVCARMHAAGIKGLQLAEEAGICNTYLSDILHGKRGSEQAKDRILAALDRLENKRKDVIA